MDRASEPPTGRGYADSREITRNSFVSVPEVISAFRPSLVARAQRRLQSIDDAEDAVEDVIVAYLSHSDGLRCDNIKGYLMRAVEYRAIDLIRHGRKAVPFNEDLHAKTALAESDYHQEVPPGLLFRAVRRLPPQARRVILLRYKRRKSYAGIAAELNISARTVEVHLRRAHAMLRSVLSKGL